MLDEGTEAPTVTLPGVVEGEPRDVDIGDYVGEGILVLAFYPADFSPACEDDACDLTELDLFTMQQDVDIFAISPDSVFSHRRFAEEYSLSIPLLSDTHGEALDAYDVRLDSDQLLAERAVFVVDQEGVIRYAWATADLEERPDVDAVREAVSDIGGDSTAVGRYRVGHAHYMEGRRGFTSAMGSYEDRDWLIAQGDFERAMAEFQESADQFQSAVRFAESDALEAGFERAYEKATALWQAAEWLAGSASAFASGNGEKGDNLRRDAESPLKTARDIGEPPDPDDIRLDPAADAEGEGETGTDTEGSAPTADPSPDVDPEIGTPTAPDEDESTSRPAGESTGEAVTDEDIDAAVEEVEADGEATDDGTADPADPADPGEPEADIDETIAEVRAEMAADGEDAATDRQDPGVDGTGPVDDATAPEGAAADADDGTQQTDAVAGDKPGSEAESKAEGDGETDGAAASDGADEDGDGDVELDLTDPDG